MALPVALLSCLARSAVKHIANFMTYGIAGDLVLDAWDAYSRHVRDESARHHEVQSLAAASSAEVHDAVRAVLQSHAPNLPPDELARVAQLLTLTPSSIRRSFRRPGEPTGNTLPAGQRLAQADDLQALLPNALPRFRVGDRPITNVDLELTELLGVGGFGEVWKARNPNLPKQAAVALKICLDPKARQQLMTHEAKILAQVMQEGRHPGIVPLLRTYLRADPPCLEYECVEGCDLASLIRDFHRHESAEPRRMSRLVLQLAEIVAFAHSLEPPVVHRDLKPTNILVSMDPELVLRVADFGIGGLAVQHAMDATRKGTTSMATVVAGSYTPLYASPQQMMGGKPDPRDDVYSLGVIWHQMLTGELNKGAPTGEAWKRRLIDKGMTKELLRVLAACLEGESADRPANAGVLAERLKQAMGEKPAEKARPPALPVAKSATKAKPAGKPVVSPELLPPLVPQAGGKNWLKIALWAIAGLFCFVLVVALIGSSTSKPRSTPKFEKTYVPTTPGQPTKPAPQWYDKAGMPKK